MVLQGTGIWQGRQEVIVGWLAILSRLVVTGNCLELYT